MLAFVVCLIWYLSSEKPVGLLFESCYILLKNHVQIDYDNKKDEYNNKKTFNLMFITVFPI